MFLSYVYRGGGREEREKAGCPEICYRLLQALMALEGLPLLHQGWLGWGTALSQRHALSPPLPQVPLVTCGQIGYRKKKKYKENKSKL